MKRIKCLLCGKFRKLAAVIHFSCCDDYGSNYEEWFECKECTAPVNLEATQ